MNFSGESASQIKYDLTMDVPQTAVLRNHGTIIHRRISCY